MSRPDSTLAPERNLIPAAVFGLIVLTGWELSVAILDLDSRLFPSPSEIGRALASQPGVIARSTAITAVEIAIGFLAGVIVGSLTGLLLTTWKWTRSALYPWLIASQTIPTPAVAALLVIWFGFTLLPKVLVVALIVFFPVAVATTDGLRSVDEEMVRLVRSLGASRWRILREVEIPGALPQLFTGMKVGATYSVLGAVFGEWVGARGGLGYLLLLENRAADTAGVFAVILVLSLLGMSFFGLIVLAERWSIPWQQRGP